MNQQSNALQRLGRYSGVAVVLSIAALRDRQLRRREPAPLPDSDQGKE